MASFLRLGNYKYCLRVHCWPFVFNPSFSFLLHISCSIIHIWPLNYRVSFIIKQLHFSFQRCLQLVSLFLYLFHQPVFLILWCNHEFQGCGSRFSCISGSSRCTRSRNWDTLWPGALSCLICSMKVLFHPCSLWDTCIFICL